MFRRELEVFFNALRFFTRLPAPAWVGYSADMMAGAPRWLPAMGWLVGGAAAATYWLAVTLFPPSLAVVMALAAGVWLTGAFHEDGFADVCDGFGGGWDKAQVLAIMKDSRVGSYGVIGVVLLIGAKAAALIEMEDGAVLLALLVAHPLSRLAAVVLMSAMDYVREDEASKSRPLAQRLPAASLAWAALWGLAPLLLLEWQEALAVAVCAGFSCWLAGRYFLRRIGGYTGDCLGATQQVCELACYLGLYVAWS